MFATVATHAARNSRLISGGAAWFEVDIARRAAIMVVLYSVRDLTVSAVLGFSFGRNGVMGLAVDWICERVEGWVGSCGVPEC